MVNTKIIEASGINKSFGQFQALFNVSLQAVQGEVLALLGANGAGKTTLINILLGRMRADSGKVSVLGNQPGHIRARQKTGVILQSAQMPGTLKVFEHINLFSSYYVSPMRLDAVLKTAKLTDIKNKRFDQLSGGQKQRVFFALAICGKPQMVFLDEPTVGLDVEARRDFWRCIRSLRDQGTTVLLTTHYLEEADVLSDRIVLLSQGKVVSEGSSEHIKKQLGGSVIRFRSAIASNYFKELSGVTHYGVKGSYHELVSSSVEETVKLLLNDCSDISDLSVSQVSLEDAFLKLNNNQ